MSAFSFTAPFVSEEQEQAEFSGFTEEVKEEIQNDLHAKSEFKVRDQPDILPESLILLEEALGTIPMNEKKDYTEALERVPHLVQQESPGESFLRATEFDPWAAAQRLVSYWKLRKEFFADRAFLPMTLDGAMREDRSVFDLGFCMLLPTDVGGRQVMFWNRIACTRAVAHRDVFVGIRLLRKSLFVLRIGCI